MSLLRIYQFIFYYNLLMGKSFSGTCKRGSVIFKIMQTSQCCFLSIGIGTCKQFFKHFLILILNIIYEKKILKAFKILKLSTTSCKADFETIFQVVMHFSFLLTYLRYTLKSISTFMKLEYVQKHLKNAKWLRISYVKKLFKVIDRFIISLMLIHA